MLTENAQSDLQVDNTKQAIKRRMAERLRSRRVHLTKTQPDTDWSQAEVAKRLGDLRGVSLAGKTYGHYETGLYEVAATDVPLLAQILGVDVDYLYGISSEEDWQDDEIIALYRGMETSEKSLIGALARQIAETRRLHAQNLYTQNDQDEAIHGIAVGN